MGNRRRNASLCKSCYCCSEEGPPPPTTSRGHVRHKTSDGSRKDKEAVFNSSTTTGVYEDMMLYVKDQQAFKVNPYKRRGRGRPRKMPEVIYVPSTAVRAGTSRVLPRNVVECRQHLVTHRISQVNSQDEEVIDWPDDLVDLANNWDNLPENDERQLVKWLVNGPVKRDYPAIVRRIHKLVIAGPGNTFEEKILEMESLLQNMGELPLPSPPPPTVTVPKVVVEAEPVSLQNSGQWSSMTESEAHCPK